MEKRKWRDNTFWNQSDLKFLGLLTYFKQGINEFKHIHIVFQIPIRTELSSLTLCITQEEIVNLERVQKVSWVILQDRYDKNYQALELLELQTLCERFATPCNLLKSVLKFEQTIDLFPLNTADDKSTRDH